MGAMVGNFIPTCDADGTYSSMQCHGSTGYCWCVTQDGTEIEGTSAAPWEERPDCDGKY